MSSPRSLHSRNSSPTRIPPAIQKWASRASQSLIHLLKAVAQLATGTEKVSIAMWLAYCVLQMMLCPYAVAQIVNQHIEYELEGWDGGNSETLYLAGPITAVNQIPVGSYLIKNSQGVQITQFNVANQPADPGSVILVFGSGPISDHQLALQYPSLSTFGQYASGQVPWGQMLIGNVTGWTLCDSNGNVVGDADGGTWVTGSCIVAGAVFNTSSPVSFNVTYNPSTDRTNPTFPPPPVCGPMVTSTAQAAPGQNRKVAFNGRPMPDSEPQAKPESDAAREESYVDAFTLGLHHDTTDIYVPVASTDLVLQVRRSTAPEVWSQRHGLLPSEMPDRPFGSGWTSNLGANIHFVRQNPIFASPLLDPNYAYVTDEDGSTYRFLIVQDPNGKEAYIVLPEARNEQDAYVNTLTINNSGQWIFQRKYGTRLTFEDAGINLVLPGDRITMNASYQETHSFSRLVTVTDRTGCSLVYTYSTSSGTIIPSSIAAMDAQSHLTTQKLSIQSDANGKVQTVTDPKNQIWSYAYIQQPSPTACTTLSSVTGPTIQGLVNGAMTATQPPPVMYGYSIASIDDTLPGQLSEPHYHCDVSSIQDSLGKTHTIHYQVDQSCNVYFGPVIGYYPVPGLSRTVSEIDLPDSIGTTMFQNHSFIAAQPDYSTPSLVFVGHKAAYIIDAVGNGCLHQFTMPSIYDMTDFMPFFPNRQIINPYTVPHIVLFQQEIITPFTGSNVAFNETDPNNFSWSPAAGTSQLHNEQFSFDLLAGMAPASTTDFSNNTTTFTYGDSWNFLANYSFLTGVNYAFGRYADPTLRTDAKTQTKSFTYYPAPAPGTFDPRARRMTQMIDEAGRKTVYTLDAYGNHTKEQVYDQSGTLISWIEYQFSNTSFPGFMTKRIVHAGNSGAE